jgi:Na+-translocating ferredoxin:NAD+ oxidoreductase RnfC subunit
MNFFGGSILALVIMNLTSPLFDRVGMLKPAETKKEPTLPRAQQFETIKIAPCIRCGVCMVSCCHKLSPILIKEAFDKANVEQLKKLQANLCEGCGHCTFVCPARIDLRNSMLRAKASLRTAK